MNTEEDILYKAAVEMRNTDYNFIIARIVKNFLNCQKVNRQATSG